MTWQPTVVGAGKGNQGGSRAQTAGTVTTVGEIMPREGYYVTIAEWLDIADTPEEDEWRQYQVDYPEDCRGNFYIKIYEIAREDPGRLIWIEREGINRDPGWGTFRKLIEMKEPGTYDPDVPEDDHILWMSDTRAEVIEHAPIIEKLHWCRDIP